MRPCLDMLRFANKNKMALNFHNKAHDSEAMSKFGYVYEDEDYEYDYGC